MRHRSRPTILADLEDRLATDEDGAVVGFIGRTRVSPGTPAPGQEAEAARHVGRSVESLGYEAHETMAIRVLTAIADEIASGSASSASRSSIARGGPARRGEHRRRRRGAPPRRGVRRRAVRDRRDEGPGADLEGGAIRRRPRLDRRAGPEWARPGLIVGGSDRLGSARSARFGSTRPARARVPIRLPDWVVARPPDRALGSPRPGRAAPSAAWWTRDPRPSARRASGRRRRSGRSAARGRRGRPPPADRERVAQGRGRPGPRDGSGGHPGGPRRRDPLGQRLADGLGRPSRGGRLGLPVDPDERDEPGAGAPVRRPGPADRRRSRRRPGRRARDQPGRIPRGSTRRRDSAWRSLPRSSATTRSGGSSP